MEKHFIIPKFPLRVSIFVVFVLAIEFIAYGIMLAVPSTWVLLLFAGFYLSYLALFRRDALPAIYTIVLLTAHHTLFLNLNSDLPIALLFMLIFIVNSGIMWLLLHYATHLKPEYHLAYSVISGFMIAQILTLYATLAREWPIRLELAAYIPAVFSYIFWRFACLSADSMLGWKQFLRVGVLVIILILLIILGSPNVQV